MLSQHPHFVAKLIDGRLLVVEYQGGDRFSNDDCGRWSTLTFAPE